jgi:hypothetical protein
MTDEIPSCKICTACGEDGCCSATMCVQHKDGEYCQGYLEELKIGYKMFEWTYNHIYGKIPEELQKEIDEEWSKKMNLGSGEKE